MTATRWFAGAALLIGSSLLVACSDDDTGSSPAPTAVEQGDGTGTDSADDAASSESPEQFSGALDDFYVVPDPLPAGEPGELIRVQDLGTEDGRTTLRVMYHSQDVSGADRAVTGIITYPVADAPEGGWPVVAWAHGTTGLASHCAPSRSGAPAPGFGIEGVHVSTDYIGLGPVGELHSYLSGTSEANSVIDSVRAARNLPEAEAGTRWVAAGHSQGGHAALFTLQLADSYAPELDHLGTISTAPAAMLEHRYGPDDDIVPRMVQVMGLYGMAADYPEIDPHDYVSDEVAAVDEVIETGCTMDIVGAMGTIPAETFYDQDPITTEPARSIVLENDPGRVAVDAPLLLVYGTTDWWVVPARVQALNERLCDLDQTVEMVEVANADHDTLVGDASTLMGEWFQDRFDGEEPVDTCP